MIIIESSLPATERPRSHSVTVGRRAEPGGGGRGLAEARCHGARAGPSRRRSHTDLRRGAGVTGRENGSRVKGPAALSRIASESLTAGDRESSLKFKSPSAAESESPTRD